MSDKDLSHLMDGFETEYAGDENDTVAHWEEALADWPKGHPDALRTIDEDGKNPADGSDVSLNCRKAVHNLRINAGLLS